MPLDPRKELGWNVVHLGSEPLRITPKPEKEAFGSCSVDLRLGQDVLLSPMGTADRRDIWESFECVETLEYVELPNDLAGRIDGRSRYARLGLIVQCASLIDPGYKGHIMLELANLGRETLHFEKGESICALSFEMLDQPTDLPYHAKEGARFNNV